MKAETCSYYVLLINYILYNNIVIDYQFMHFINYWKHKMGIPNMKNVFSYQWYEISFR